MIDSEQFLTARGVLDQAATSRGLIISQDWGHEGAFSNPITSIPIDYELLKYLSKNDFEFTDRSDGIITVFDRHPGETHGASNYWNIKKDRPLEFKAGVELKMSRFDRGVVFLPQIGSNFSGALHRPTNEKMLRVLAEYQGEATPDLLRELVENKGRLVVLWKELDLAGIRKVYDLYKEAYGSMKYAEAMADNPRFPLRPLPGDPKVSGLYVPEPIQPELFRQWQSQINEVRYSIVRPSSL